MLPANLVPDGHEDREGGHPLMLVFLDTEICSYAVEGASSFQSKARRRLATMWGFTIWPVSWFHIPTCTFGNGFLNFLERPAV
jgi:hypothetical protein